MARILLVCGSTRTSSTNSAALRTLQALAPADFETSLYEGLADLPAFNPDHDVATAGPAVAAVRAALGAADAVVVCTPEYAGTLPGSLKNLLDWTVGSGELYGKPVAWINVAVAGRGGGADATLGTVLGYVAADVITPGGVRVPVQRAQVGPDGMVADPAVRAGLAAVAQTIVDHLAGRS